MSRILVIDIETRPILGYFWKIWDENIGVSQIKEPSRPMTAAWKWVGKAGIQFTAEWQYKDRYRWLRDVHGVLSEADGVVSQNGDKFDLPKLNGAFLLAGLEPIPPVTSIDIRKTTKKLGYDSTSLDFIARIFDIGKKMEHEGFPLWIKVMAGDKAAQAKMEKYNKHDVFLTDAAYTRLLPYISNHPHIHGTPCSCPNCGSKKLQRRGFRFTRTSQIERLKCMKCGAWHSGTRSKIK